ncbi:hypothetical protein ABK040_000611 [Willaertia magna]
MNEQVKENVISSKNNEIITDNNKNNNTTICSSFNNNDIKGDINNQQEKEPNISEEQEEIKENEIYYPPLNINIKSERLTYTPINQIATFQPPLYLQRKILINSYLNEIRNKYFYQKDENSPHYTDIERIIEVGCGEGNILKYLINCQFKRMDGIDKDLNSLENAKLNCQPLIIHSLQPLKPNLNINLFNVDIIDFVKNNLNNNLINKEYCKNPFYRMYDVCYCSEVIEHIYLEDLIYFEEFLFKYINSNVIIITTPNYEFNHWFINMSEKKDVEKQIEKLEENLVIQQQDEKYNSLNGSLNNDLINNNVKEEEGKNKDISLEVNDKEEEERKKKIFQEEEKATKKQKVFLLEEHKNKPFPFRDSDHKFEWTRSEFNDWIKHIEEEYNEYKCIHIGGVGQGVDNKYGYATVSTCFIKKQFTFKECKEEKEIQLENQFLIKDGKIEYPKEYIDNRPIDERRENQCCNIYFRVTDRRNYLTLSFEDEVEKVPLKDFWEEYLCYYKDNLLFESMEECREYLYQRATNVFQIVNGFNGQDCVVYLDNDEEE